MTIPNQVPGQDRRPLATGAALRESNCRSVLGTIRGDGVSLAVWNRSLSASLRWATASLPALMPVYRQFTLAPDDPARGPLTAAVGAFAGLTHSAARIWCEDLMGLVAVARSIAPAASLRVHVQSRANHAYERFHADHVALRVICTYRGAGTEYLETEALDVAGHPPGCGAPLLDPSKVREICPGAVAVMKGLRYPGAAGRALLHRSPPASPTWPRILALIDIHL